MNAKANLFKVAKNVYFEKKTPVSLIHFLTNRCNARCSFCFIDFDNPKTFEGELTLEEIDKMTKTFGNTLMNINFTGGEPFARKDIVDIAKLYIKNTSIRSMYVTTNGSLPDRVINFAKVVSELDPELELCFQISIDHLPDEHNKIRKINKLFENCILTYNSLKKLNKSNINPVVSITVTHENCDDLEKIFNHLTKEEKIDYLKCTIVRDEGVYKRPQDKIEKILSAYNWLTDKIIEYQKSKNISNYNDKSLQGKVHYQKDKISFKLTQEIYKNNEYVSPCHAASLFGIITADGKVHPCEILEDKMIGDLRKHNMNFTEVWNSQKKQDVKNFILDTKCRCTYECALSFNILGNWRYQAKLLTGLLSKY
ncbi:radical SAM protein [Candidatus Pelagibacter bacterium]|nr:radical SAM protein [Candidatus Pelagibacter bacterium]MDA9624941.1 radical SAM protein [Candidatus Pelagibacter bacterium]